MSLILVALLVLLSFVLIPIPTKHTVTHISDFLRDIVLRFSDWYRRTSRQLRNR